MEMLEFVLSKGKDLPFWNTLSRVLSRFKLESEDAAVLLRALDEQDAATGRGNDVRYLELAGVVANTWWSKPGLSLDSVTQLIELHAAIGGKPLSEPAFADVLERAQRHGRLNTVASSFIEIYRERFPGAFADVHHVDVDNMVVKVALSMPSYKDVEQYVYRTDLLSADWRNTDSEVVLTVVGVAPDKSQQPLVINSYRGR